MVKLTAISKTYHTSLSVLDHIDLDLKAGEFLYIVGGTGAGKSSLLRMIATLENPTSGTLSLFGYALNRVPPQTLRHIRQCIGYVPQDLQLISDLTVEENILFSHFLSRSKRGNLSKEIDELLERLGLTAQKHEKVSSLSGGEAQRVAIARALIRNPELLIVDEPTGAQDREWTWALMDLLVRCNAKGSTVMMATHDREIVRRVTRRCALLKGGHVRIEDGPCFY